MAKRTRKPITPRSQIRNSIRGYVWMRSRERAEALKQAGYTCASCGRKQSKAKGREFAVQVHHKEGISNWDKLIDAFYEFLLVSPDKLEVLCKECHVKEHEKEAAE